MLLIWKFWSQIYKIFCSSFASFCCLCMKRYKPVGLWSHRAFPASAPIVLLSRFAFSSSLLRGYLLNKSSCALLLIGLVSPAQVKTSRNVTSMRLSLTWETESTPISVLQQHFVNSSFYNLYSFTCSFIYSPWMHYLGIHLVIILGEHLLCMRHFVKLQG